MLLGRRGPGRALASGHVCTNRDRREGWPERGRAWGRAVVDHVVCRTVRPPGLPGPSGSNHPRALGVGRAVRPHVTVAVGRGPAPFAGRPTSPAHCLLLILEWCGPARGARCQAGGKGPEGTQSARGLGTGAGWLVSAGPLTFAGAPGCVAGCARRRLGGHVRAVALGRARRRLIARRRWARLGRGR